LKQDETKRGPILPTNRYETFGIFRLDVAGHTSKRFGLVTSNRISALATKRKACIRNHLQRLGNDGAKQNHGSVANVQTFSQRFVTHSKIRTTKHATSWVTGMLGVWHIG
jgi:hypothetical protein